MTLGGDVHDGAVVAALERRLSAFRVQPVAQPEVQLEVGASRLSPPPGSGRTVYQSPGVDVLYYDDAGELYVDHPAGVRLRCHPAAGRIQLSVPARDRSCVGLATHPLFTVALIEVLKQRGRFSLHAGCAAVGDQGILVAGPSGAGKSTLAVAMARAGMAFLSDDTVFLTQSGGSVQVLGFPDEVDVTDHTIALFPDLAQAARAPSVNGREKRSLRLEEALPVTSALRCQPAALVLPRVTRRDRSRLGRVSGQEALLDLAPNVLLTDLTGAQAHFDVLRALAASTPCYRLATGTDLELVPDLLAGLAHGTG
ncbi:MAG: hypothetical protein M3083_21345 [Actinomycetota bacterium]|nr:hypothetical protein [Actinomycetota bacterium]